jgi:hypothetical protein
MTSKNYYSPKKSNKNNHSMDKMSQTVKSRANIASNNSLLSNRKDKASVSAHSNSKDASFYKKTNPKDTSFYNKNPLKPKIDKNINSIRSKSKVSSNRSNDSRSFSSSKKV